MKVYVLNIGYDYEGERTLGVYATEAGAVAAVKAHAAENYRDIPDKPERFPGGTLKWAIAGGDYFAYALDVQGAAAGEPGDR